MREYLVNGRFSLAPAAGNTIYGRLAESADFPTLRLPSYERALCPDRALAVRLGPDGLVHNAASPDKTYVAPPGRTHAQMSDDFEHQVLVQQPLRVVAGILGDWIRLAALGRYTSTGDTPISRWQFQTSYPTYGDSIFLGPGGTIKVGLHYAASGGPTVVQTLTPSSAARPRSAIRWPRSCAATSWTAATRPGRCWPWPRCSACSAAWPCCAEGATPPTGQ